MKVINQLISHFRFTDHWSDELQDRLEKLNLLAEELDGDEYYGWCEECDEFFCSSIMGNSSCDLEGHELEVEQELTWLMADAVQRRHLSRRSRGKRNSSKRRRETTCENVRKALRRRYVKWSMPGGRLDRLRRVGGMLTHCNTWQEAAKGLLSEPVPQLVQHLGKCTRHSVRPLFNQLDDFDLALLGVSKPWRGHTGAAFRRLVKQKSDKRSHRLLKYGVFQEAVMLVELSAHLNLAREHCNQFRRTCHGRSNS